MSQSQQTKTETPERRAADLGQRVDHFTTFLLLAYAQSLFLRPMLRNVDLIARMGGGPRRAGFEQLRRTLYWTVVLEIMKLCGDRDQRTASVPSIMRELRDPAVRNILFKKHCRPGLPRMAGDGYGMWSAFSKEERARLKKQFKERYHRLRVNFSALKRSREFRAFKKARNQALAHHQVVTTKGAIKPFDAAVLKLKIGDENKLLELTRGIAVDLNSIVRGASFSGESYLETETRDVCAFWEIESLDGPVKI